MKPDSVKSSTRPTISRFVSPALWFRRRPWYRLLRRRRSQRLPHRLQQPQSKAPEQGEPVLSPIVGTAYLTPEPGAANFIQVGASVTKGQTLMIVEAMKVMNPIQSPRAGTVKQILVENGQPVEYGQVLVILE